MILNLDPRWNVAEFVVRSVISTSAGLEAPRESFSNQGEDVALLSARFWTECLAFAETIHAVAPFCSAVLKQTWADRIEEGSLLRLNERITRERMLLAVLDQELDEALFQLISSQVPVAVLKGADLARRYYPERALRPMADVDLFVRPDLFTEALTVLGKAGYRAVGPFPEGRFRIELARDRGGVYQCPTVEIHRQLLAGDDDAHTQRIWERTIEGAVPGLPRSARSLRPDDNLVYLIRHAAVQHAIESPVWMNDIHWLIETESGRGCIDWDQVIWRLAHERALSAGFVVFSLLGREWGTRIPEEILRQAGQRLGWVKRGLLSPLARSRNLFPERGRGKGWLVRSRFLLRDGVYDAWKYGIGRLGAQP